MEALTVVSVIGNQEVMDYCDKHKLSYVLIEHIDNNIIREFLDAGDILVISEGYKFKEHPRHFIDSDFLKRNFKSIVMDNGSAQFFRMDAHDFIDDLEKEGFDKATKDHYPDVIIFPGGDWFEESTNT